MTLYDLQQGEKAIITKVKGIGAFRKRIIEMGFVVGQQITVIRKAPLQDPIEYNIMSYNVSLRGSEAKLIEVVTESEAKELKTKEFEGILNGELLIHTARKKEKIINVAFVGNPNCGKTTLFNHFSGKRERVGNYGGVTVDAKAAKFKHKDYIFNAVDLPGTYSLTAYSPEELYVRNHISEALPDVIVNVIDASNLERNLYLTTQLIDMDLKVVASLNMFDELQKNGDHINYEYLGKMIGIPFVPTIGSKGRGMNLLLEKIIEVYEGKDQTVRHVHINYGKCIEKGIQRISDVIRIPQNIDLTSKISPRFLSIKLLEKDQEVLRKIEECDNNHEIIETGQKEILRIEEALQDDTETLITDAKFGFIAGALKETLKPSAEKRKRKSDTVDTLITHKLWGIPFFILFMYLTFFSTFKLGEYPMQWIDYLVELASTSLHQSMPQGMLKDLMVDGILGGIGGVIIFLPNILILYFFISLMEDTGYMARAVFIMDKAMHKIGLHGKSFIPLLMGFGCNVPAILSTRIIESRRDRILTMLINPFMSCSARLPVYILFITAFFSSYRGSMLFLMYLIGIILAIISALLFKKTMFKKEEMPFVMELPPYRIPSLKTLLKHMWHRAEQYLKKIGGIILIASIIIWALGYFPRNVEYSKDYSALIKKTENEYKDKISQLNFTDSLSYKAQLSSIEEKRIENIRNLELAKVAEKQEKSFIGRIGKTVEPIMRPLGFDWKMTVGIISGVAAKEVVISTLGVLYQSDPDSDAGQDASLITKLQNQTYKDGDNAGQKIYTPLVAFSFMLFILIYFPCVAVIAAIRKESGKWKYALFSIFYTTTLAWLMSFMVYQIGLLLT